MSKRKKIPKNISIAGVEVDLTKSRDENWAMIEKAIEDSFSATGLYDSLMKRSAPNGTKDAWGMFVSVIARIIAFFYGIFFMATAHRKAPILLSARKKLDEYYYDTLTQIQVNQAKLREQIQRLDKEIMEIDSEIYKWDAEKHNPDMTESYMQELEMMQNRFESEKALRKAKTDLLLKCLAQAEKIEKAYKMELSMHESRIKLEKLRLSGDDDLAVVIASDAKIQVLKSYVLQLKTTQEDVLKEEDYQRIIEMERAIERIEI